MKDRDEEWLGRKEETDTSVKLSKGRKGAGREGWERRRGCGREAGQRWT